MKGAIIMAIILLSGCMVIVQKPGATQQVTVEGQEIIEAPKDSVTRDRAGETDYQPEAPFAGKVLAGSTTAYLDFNKADYDQALKGGKIILLNFYATWCPLCQSEQKEVFAAFNEMQYPNVIGFRVNYKDANTDADEKALAQEFGVPYQHTKVIIKDGKKVLKAPDSWDRQRYLDEIKKVV